MYLLDEILDMTRQSPESALAIAEAVQKKLGAKSPVTKFKVCARAEFVAPVPAKRKRCVCGWGAYDGEQHTCLYLTLALSLLALLWQALRIIKHLCTKGSTQFQRCMQKYSSSVK